MNPIFNTSKITQICYHGTDSSPFTELDKSKLQVKPEDGDPGYFGWGFYLTTDLEYAKEYGNNVLAFHVNIQNPFPFSEVNYMDMLNFIFEDSGKLLSKHIQDTMYFLRLVGENKELEFENQNSSALREKCLETYKKYKDFTEFNEDELQEIKTLMAELAKHINNWLNGLFMYFAREVFHYITLNGFDGVIADNGKEIVVYETEQLEPVEEPKPEDEEVTEDIKPQEASRVPYTLGSSDFMQDNLYDFFSRNDITDFRVYQDIYPLRKHPIWYTGTLFTFVWKNAIEIHVYADECDGYVKLDDGTLCSTASELEELGIYTDEDLDEVIDEDEGWDEASNRFDYYAQVLDANGHDAATLDSWDLNWEACWDIDDLLPLNWTLDFISDVISKISNWGDSEEAYRILAIKGIIDDPEYYETEEETVEEDIQPVERPVPEWQEGKDEWMNSIKRVLDNHRDVITDYEFYTDIYPQRDRTEWYPDECILVFTYKNGLDVCFYVGGEVCVPTSANPGGNDFMYGPYDFEQNGIYTDEDLEELINDVGEDLVWDWDTPYINFRITLIDDYDTESNVANFGGSIDKYGYDMGYDDMGCISGWLQPSYLDAFIKYDIPDIIAKYRLKSNNEEVDEDLELTQDDRSRTWNTDNGETQRKIINYLSNNPEITNYSICQPINSLRQDPVWFEPGNVWWFDWNNILRVRMYCYKDGGIYLSDDDDAEKIRDAWDLETNDIYTDAELYEATEEVNDPWCDCYNEFGFCIEVLDKNGNPIGRPVYWCDINYDPIESPDLREIQWEVEDLIKDVIYDADSIFEEEQVNKLVEAGIVQVDEDGCIIHANEDLHPVKAKSQIFDNKYIHVSRRGDSKESITGLINDFGDDDCWEVCGWTRTSAAYSYHFGPTTFADAYDNFLGQINNTLQYSPYFLYELRLVHGHHPDRPYDSITVLSYDRDEHRTDEDLQPQEAVVPEWDPKYVRYNSAEYVSNIIYSECNSCVWQVCCWKLKDFSYSRCVDNLTFAEAYKDFLAQLKNTDWRCIEVRYKPEENMFPQTILFGKPNMLDEEAQEDKKLTKQQLLNDLIDVFGIIDVKDYNKSDATYILRDGSLLDTKGIYDNHQHENISKYIRDKYNLKDNSEDGGSKFMNSIGAIRVTPWIPGIIVTHHKLTEAQENTLFSIIKLLSTQVNKDHPLMITSEDGSQFIEYRKIKNPEEIITSILGYQILGILKEHLAPGKEFKFLNHLK